MKFTIDTAKFNLFTNLAARSKTLASHSMNLALSAKNKVDAYSRHRKDISVARDESEVFIGLSQEHQGNLWYLSTITGLTRTKVADRLFSYYGPQWTMELNALAEDYRQGKGRGL